MRILKPMICALPLMMMLGCQVESHDDVIVESQQELGSKKFFNLLWRISFAQRYPVGTLTTTVVRTEGLPGAPVPADIYYPKVHGAYFADAFPMVSVLPGGNVPKEQYSNFARQVASFGFVVTVSDLEQSFAPGAPPLLLTSQWVPNWVEADLIQRDADPSSPLFGIVDTDNMGLAGHSFGAGALLASVQGTCEIPFCIPSIPPFTYTRPASIKAAVAHGFINCDPSGNGCFFPDTSAVPVMLVNGGLDDPGPPTDEAYDSFELPKSLVVLDRVNHFGLTNDDLATPDGPNPEPNELSQSRSNRRTARWTVLWYRMILQGDPIATRLVVDSGGLRGATVTADL